MSGNETEWRLDERGLVMMTRTDQSGHQVGLREAARGWTLIWMAARCLGFRPGPTPESYPYSHPLHLICRAGTRQPAGALPLNPAFTDWIMGWPIGWTEPDAPATEWSAWLRRSRIALSRIDLVAEQLNPAPHDATNRVGQKSSIM
jgi:hypothetical protein